MDLSRRLLLFPGNFFYSAFAALIVLFPAACQNSPVISSKPMIVSSNSFKNEDKIPAVYTCDGLDFSPHLEWSGFPASAKSFSLICNDPDAPAGDWIHWLIANIPAPVHSLDEHFIAGEKTSLGIVAGINDFKLYEYGGPCPPGGTHRYYFRVYALDTKLNLMKGFTVAELRKAMKGHIVSEGVLMGRYSRK
jgi:Raf kinase inhibitor-like YbhB/YbcL family protein